MDGETRVALMRRRDSGESWVAQGHRLSKPQADEVVELLLAARRQLSDDLLPHPEHVVDYPSARAVLSAVWTSAVTTVTAAATGGSAAVSTDLVSLLQSVKEVDERILVAQVRYRDQAFQRVRDALAMLGEAKSSKALVDLAPVTACSLGFDRSIISRVEDSLWIPERVHVERDTQWAEEILEVGRAQPQVLNGTLVETEMVRRRTPILVDQVQDRPGVHRPIADASMSRSYSAAPIMIKGEVAGFVHVDCYYQQRNLDEADRQVLAMYTEGLGQALSRTMVLDRLDGIRSDMDSLTRRVSEARDDTGAPCPWGIEEPVLQADSRRPRVTAGVEQFLHHAPVDPTLTRREVEVLRLMAAGDTNARIARRLVISEGTVKSHVKHVLRKLGAANRAEAVSHWLRMGQGMQREHTNPGDAWR
ncbi:LuxR C-terminal-related transcriptional regulator [Pseudonocardia sp. RS11V-5]|uniref:LuxR C-terminal-related transcriptional regulator n=1 Tax=Pseudonocardia terrae TaxID=2905831 RepID=UPI001E4067EF|nr:LuxR C-terminal-related transcriptional regulator [Pseudonocardia terrae]MCE3552847.1 LuxR C-terminal-related transcriptional regulator [Pseudonocardia terrae]